VSRMSNLNVILAMDVHTRVSLFISKSLEHGPQEESFGMSNVHVPFREFGLW